MASTDPQRLNTKFLTRLLHLKKSPEESRHPLIHPPAAAATAGDRKKTRGFSFHGLGCAMSAEALAPPESAAAAAVRSAAEWQGAGKKKRTRRRRRKRASGRAQLTTVGDVADVSDVWCAPGVVFGAEASVDCVVAHRQERAHRERACISRRNESEEFMTSFLDCPSTMEMPRFVSDPFHSGHLRYMRGGHRRSPAECEEMMLFQTGVFLGRMDVHDQYKDLRLDVDNMSYEELLELSEKIGYVNTGLREEEILRNLRKPKHSFFGASPSQKEWKCIICQEEYEVDDDMGRLECGHSYHTHCIKQWLLMKNACPVCKTAMAIKLELVAIVALLL